MTYSATGMNVILKSAPHLTKNQTEILFEELTQQSLWDNNAEGALLVIMDCYYSTGPVTSNEMIQKKLQEFGFLDEHNCVYRIVCETAKNKHPEWFS